MVRTDLTQAVLTKANDQITKTALIQKGASFAFPQNKMGSFSAFINALFQAFP